jgi:hypothetical protein
MTNKTHLNHLRSVTTRCCLLIMPLSSSSNVPPIWPIGHAFKQKIVQICLLADPYMRLLPDSKLSNISAPCIPRFFATSLPKKLLPSGPQQETSHPSPARPSTLHRHPGWVTNTTEADRTTSSSSPYPVRKAPWTAWNGWFWSEKW